MEDQAKEDILQKVEQTILLAQRCLETDDVDCSKVMCDMQHALRTLGLIRGQLTKENVEAIQSTLLALQDQLKMKIENSPSDRQYAFAAPRDVNGGRGRPKVLIEEDQLKMLHKLDYTAKQMAKHFGCSTPVVYKRLYACGLHQRDKYSDTANDDDLDRIVDEAQKNFPNAGSVMMSGLLQSKGVFVQRTRLRKSIDRVNPIPVAQRFTNTVSRRQYHVRMSNSLWHVDGHMKLARWGISTHGCIDGHSRLIVFLEADTDNKATTVVKHFVGACKKYGVPSRVRSDYGGENIMIALFMNMVNGQQRHSHITGRSVHNQRIERLWRDVYCQVVEKYYNQFYSMEDNGELDPENRLHLLAVKYAVVPLLNKQLQTFKEGWNLHKLSTENNLSPQQLWLDGVLGNVNASCQEVQNLYGNTLEETFEDRLREYGLDPVDFRDTDDSEQSILTLEQAEQLRSTLTAEQVPTVAYHFFEANNIQNR